MVGLGFAILLTGAGVWLDSILFGSTTLAEVTTLFYLKIFSLPILLNVLLGGTLIRIKRKAMGLTVILLGVLMSMFFPTILAPISD